MTLLQLPALGSSASHVKRRRAVTLLCGFLGSGKTTLLRKELARAGANAPAVVLNDFGHTVVDDALLANEQDQPVVISGGCVCCSRRQHLALALRDLLDAEQRGRAPRRDQIVIETSGLSDPGPIAFTLADDPILKHHFALARICVTVDALTALRDIDCHEIAGVQVLAADDLLITKADLANPGDVERLVGRLHGLNPSASITVTANGERVYDERPLSTLDHRPATRPAAPAAAHTRDVSTFEFTTNERLEWQAFSVWLSLLLHARGPDVLRVKGVLHTRYGHVAINAVQHIMHRPEHLTGHTPPGSRLVFIIRNIDTELLERSFRTFLTIS